MPRSSLIVIICSPTARAVVLRPPARLAGGMSETAVLAIDFGTTSCAAPLADGARLVQLQEPGGGFTWPSAVFVGDDLPVVGTAAANRRRLRPAAFRDELKTYL